MAKPPASFDLHSGAAKPYRGSRNHGNITEDSHSRTLPAMSKAVFEGEETKAWTGKRDWTPTQAKSWVGVVTAQLRMTNLSEIYEDVKFYSGTHLAKIQDLIDLNADKEDYLKRFQLPVICVRVPDLEIGTPDIRRVSCDALAFDQNDTVALRQRKYIGLGGLNDSMSMQMPSVGSLVRIECDNDHFYSHDGTYNGYFTKIMVNNTARILETYKDCTDLLEDKFHGQEQPQGLASTEEKSAKAEPAPSTGWYGDDQPKGKDGQRALNRGGVVDFAKNFWDSASESFGGGAARDQQGNIIYATDEDGSPTLGADGKPVPLAAIGQERTQNLRSQKPSNQ